MPIYEYACNDCGRRLSIFQRRMNSDVAPTCPHCQGRDLRRLISRFAVVRSVDDSFDDSSFAGLDEDDPRAMARWASQMGEEMGEDLGPGFDDEMSRLEGGESVSDLDDGSDFDF